jgi:orotidine-5'-phosphate decarboxylase
MNVYAMSRLQKAAQKNGPLCVGLDTDPAYLPASVLKKFSAPAEAVLAYNCAIIERLKKNAACCKVQIAYYEAMGLAGMRIYAQTLRAVKDAGLIVIADVKRGDIADTAKAYAAAHFSGDFEADIITLNPYMGFDTLTPFTEYTKAKHGSKGMFVLLRTSNSGMTDIEQQTLAAGGFVLDRVGKELLRLSAEFLRVCPEAQCSPVGAVVGCTEENNARLIRDLYPDIFFLIPGYGAQGGDARIAATLLDYAGGVVNSSRGILTAWKKSPELYARENSLTIDDIAGAAAIAAQDAKKDLLDAKLMLQNAGSAP